MILIIFSFELITIMLISYLLGCFNTGYYLVYFLCKKDIRSTGSFSTGATNVSRLYGKTGFIITFLGDSLKGFIYIYIFKYLNFHSYIIMFLILFLILGHVFPFQLQFKGGKGISVALGAFLAFDFNLIILLSISCILLFIFIRNYQICGILAFSLLPIEYMLLYKTLVPTLSLFLIIFIIFYAHIPNIKNHLLKDI